MAASSIQARMNWNTEPCKDFKNYGCSPVQSSLRVVKSAQETSYLQLQRNYNKIIIDLNLNFIILIFLRSFNT